MNDVQNLVAQAQALGAALVAHPTVRAYYEAQRGVRTDGGAQQLLREYESHVERLHRLEAEQKPIEVADKHRLREMETNLAGNALLKTLMRTQADYAALMAQINRAIDGPLADLAAQEPRA